jgi:hypothetical protein
LHALKSSACALSVKMILSLLDAVPAAGATDTDERRRGRHLKAEAAVRAELLTPMAEGEKPPPTEKALADGNEARAATVAESSTMYDRM